MLLVASRAEPVSEFRLVHRAGTSYSRKGKLVEKLVQCDLLKLTTFNGRRYYEASSKGRELAHEIESVLSGIDYIHDESAMPSRQFPID